MTMKTSSNRLLQFVCVALLALNLFQWITKEDAAAEREKVFKANIAEKDRLILMIQSQQDLLIEETVRLKDERDSINMRLDSIITKKDEKPIPNIQPIPEHELLDSIRYYINR